MATQNATNNNSTPALLIFDPLDVLMSIFITLLPPCSRITAYIHLIDRRVYPITRLLAIYFMRSLYRNRRGFDLAIYSNWRVPAKAWTRPAMMDVKSFCAIFCALGFLSRART